MLSTLEILSLEPPADRHYGALRHHLALRGNLIGPNDLLIAAHALAMDLVLVTANRREFARVPNLRLENWLTRYRGVFASASPDRARVVPKMRSSAEESKQHGEPSPAPPCRDGPVSGTVSMDARLCYGMAD